jgi:glutamate/aspartate transport system substrate-binding protein
VDGGRAVAFVMDSSLLAGLIARSKNPADFKIVGEPLSVEPIAIMMRKDDEGLKKIVNQTIADMTKSGEIYKLYDKWFMQPTPPTGAVVKLPMSELLKDALKKPNDQPAEVYAKKL